MKMGRLAMSTSASSIIIPNTYTFFNDTAVLSPWVVFPPVAGPRAKTSDILFRKIRDLNKIPLRNIEGHGPPYMACRARRPPIYATIRRTWRGISLEHLYEWRGGSLSFNTTCPNFVSIFSLIKNKQAGLRA